MGEQRAGGQLRVHGAPHGGQQAGGQLRVPGAPQGEQQAGGQPGVPGAPQGEQQAGGQPGVPEAPQGEQQAGGQPGATKTPQGGQQAGGQQELARGQQALAAEMEVEQGPGRHRPSQRVAGTAPKGATTGRVAGWGPAGGDPGTPGRAATRGAAGGDRGTPESEAARGAAGGDWSTPGSAAARRAAGGDRGTPGRAAGRGVAKTAGAPQGGQQAGGQLGAAGAPQTEQQPGVTRAPQGEQQPGGQPRVTGAPQGEQQLGGQPGVTGTPQGAQQSGGQPGVTRAPRGAQQPGGQPEVTRTPQGEQQPGGPPGAAGAPQREQQAGGQPGLTGSPQGEQQPGGQPRVTGAPQGAEQPGGQPRVTGAPQGAQQSGGQPGVTRAPQGQQQTWGQPAATGASQREQQQGGQSGVIGAPQEEQQPGGQPGVTGPPQGTQRPGGQPGVSGGPQEEQRPGGELMDDLEQQMVEWSRLLELDTPMAIAEEPGADGEHPRPPSPWPRFPCDTCFHTFATRGAAANHMRVCRAAEAKRRAQALGSIPSLVETDTQERPTPRDFGDEAWARVTSWEWEAFFSVEAVGGRTVRRIPQRARSGVLDPLCCNLKRLKSRPGDEAATLLLLAAVGGVLGGEVAEAVRAMAAARPAVRPLAYACSDQDPDAIRLSRCRARCKVGEWSRGLACLTAGELARPSEAMVQSLQEKHPASSGEVPQWVRDFTVDAPQWPPLTTDVLARAIHTAAHASAAGPSGWVTEHLRDTFHTQPSCLPHLLEVFNQWVAGQVPERARPWLAASNLVGLSKPNSDVRPVAIGEVLPRILARALCISLCPAMASYFLPCNQLGAGTRGDPLGPFLFAFTQQQMMESVIREFRDILFLSYADDTYILGPAARILEAFGVLRERLEWVGLEVQAHKCRFWEREGRDVERALPLGMQRVEEGLTLVGVPIGEEDWEVARLRERLRQLQGPLQWLPFLDHP
ncbi:unnamed protein product [Closterium sp. NIES-64]|nr:unnamed protein product [Closterium sp. NIES-64]